MVTCVLSGHGLHPTTSLGPSAPDSYPTKITKGSSWASIDIAAQDLRRERRPIVLLDCETKVAS
jgi:hypothetical protein